MKYAVSVQVAEDDVRRPPIMSKVRELNLRHTTSVESVVTVYCDAGAEDLRVEAFWNFAQQLGLRWTIQPHEVHQEISIRDQVTRAIANEIAHHELCSPSRESFLRAREVLIKFGRDQFGLKVRDLRTAADDRLCELIGLQRIAH